MAPKGKRDPGGGAIDAGADTSSSGDMPPRRERAKTSDGADGGGFTMKLGKPKPPPPPKATPPEIRMALLAETLTTLCVTLEKLAKMEQEEHTLVHNVRHAIPQRLVAIDKELEELEQSQMDTEAMHAAGQSRNALEVASERFRMQELEEERDALKTQLKKDTPVADELDAPRTSAHEQERWNESWRPEAVHYVREMLSCCARSVRIRASSTLTVLCASSVVTKQAFTSLGQSSTLEVEGVAPKLVGLLSTGALESIETVSVLTNENPKACDLMRGYHAISLLANFINTSSSEDAPMLSSLPGAAAAEPTGPTLSEPAAKWGLISSHLTARPTIVPVASKAKAVAALWNIAMSSDENLEYITDQQKAGNVIPQLVTLMCKLNEHGDDASSLSSKDNHDEETREARRSRTNNALKEKMHLEVETRKELAKENRRLAETAGKMLHTLIIKGSTKVKKVIISAIIQQVQQPGSVPPEDVPALMDILRSTAEEQLSLVQGGTDESALQAALGFGRWIKLPTLMLGEARNAFKEAQAAVAKEAQRHARRAVLGLGGGHAGATSPGGTAAPEEHTATAMPAALRPRSLKLAGAAAAGSKQHVLQQENGGGSNGDEMEGGGRAATSGGSVARGGKRGAVSARPSGGGAGGGKAGGAARVRRSAMVPLQSDLSREVGALRQEGGKRWQGLLNEQHAQQAKSAARSRIRAERFHEERMKQEIALGPRANSLMFERALVVGEQSRRPGTAGAIRGTKGGEAFRSNFGGANEVAGADLYQIEDNLERSRRQLAARQAATAFEGGRDPFTGRASPQGTPPQRYRTRPASRELTHQTVIASRLQGFEVPAHMLHDATRVVPPTMPMRTAMKSTTSPSQNINISVRNSLRSISPERGLSK